MWDEQSAGPENPQDLNRYSYVNNNPITATDPSGHCGGHRSKGGCKGGGGAGIPTGKGGTSGGKSWPTKTETVQGDRGGAKAPQPISGQNPAAEAAKAGATKPASAPVGRRGSPIEVEGNLPTTINGRDYSGHAVDRMQGRGIPPSAVENTILNGSSKPGRTPNSTIHVDSSNGVTVVTDTNSGRVVTVITTKRDK